MDAPNASICLDAPDARGIAIVTLTQPARGNPLDGALTRGIKDVAARLWDHAEAQRLRAVLLRAEGPNFCYGGDLKSFRPALATLPTIVRDWTAELHMGLQRLWSLPAPVVCAAQGFVMGGGLSLAAGCDWVIAGESSRFGAAFGQIGFSCDSGTSITLTARLGAARAKRFTMLSEVIGAAEALQMGLVERVVADAKIAAEAMALAERLAAGPTVAYGEIKRLFARAGHTAFQAQLEDEAMTLARVSATEDAGEGVAAMMEKRKPVFKGR